MSPVSAEMKATALNEGSELHPKTNGVESSPPLLENGVNSALAPTDSTTPPTALIPPESEHQLPTSSTSCEPPVPKYGTLIPNRVFVGGISTHTTESELAALFAKFGSVRGAKIIMDRAGISKGYGFVTFETEEEARRLFTAMNNRELPPIVHRDRRLNIAPAVKKQPILRQGCSYYGTSPSGSASTTLSPPPSLVESPFYFAGNPAAPVPTDFLLPSPHPHPGVEPSFLYPGHHNPYPFYPGAGTPTNTNPLGLGQALPGPNGSIIFLPLGLNPYHPNQQQPQALASDPWNSSGPAHHTIPGASFSLPHQWARLHQTTTSMAPPPPMPHPPTSHHSGNTGHYQTSHHHSHPHNHHPYLSGGGGGGGIEHSGQADPLLYFSNALISTPH